MSKIKEESKLILDFFGEPAQIVKMGEECSELSATIFQSMCATKDKSKNEQQMYSELADVWNVLNQMFLVYDERRIKSIAQMKRTQCIEGYLINKPKPTTQ